MTTGKKKRMSMLDSLAASGGPSAGGAGSMMSSNRALRSARDAVDAHHVWELDPDLIDDTRIADRLDPEDVADLRASIQANGQTVPILVRRHPTESGRYLLVYGRRRLAAVRGAERVDKVRALVATLDDDEAVRAQVSENTGRRDLSFIERALFACQLLDSGFGTQAQVAEVLNATRSAVSMAVSVGRAIGPDLAAAIGPAHGVGRPRWESLVREIEEGGIAPADLIPVARAAREEAQPGEVIEGSGPDDPSVAAFEAVARKVAASGPPAPRDTPAPPARRVALAGGTVARVRRTARGVRLEVEPDDADFADWIEAEAQSILEELHARWSQRD